MLQRGHGEIVRIVNSGTADATNAASAYAETIARELEPFNIAGLCGPAKRNMYQFV